MVAFLALLQIDGGFLGFPTDTVQMNDAFAQDSDIFI